MVESYIKPKHMRINGMLTLPPIDLYLKESQGIENAFVIDLL